MAIAEELVSDAWLRVWKKHAQFNNEATLRSYLYSTVKNACFDYLKKQKPQPTIASEQPDKTMLEQLIYAEVLHTIYRHMQNLPDQCKTVFTRLYIDGKTVKETAEEMELSVSTIKTQKARAIAYIKGKMRPLLLAGWLCLIL